VKVLKTTKLAGNPHGKRKRNRKLTPKQIAHFGTKRQRAALKAARKRKRNRTAAARVASVNPRRRAHSKRSSNPLVLHLKPIQRSNPKRRNKTVATPKRKRRMKNAHRRVAHVTRRSNRRRRRASNPRHRRMNRTPAHRTNRRHRNRRNPARTRVVVVTPRRNRRNGHRHRSKNPQLFGSSLGSKQTLKILGGGLAGVALTKFIPTLSFLSGITSTVSGTLSTFGPFVISAVSAFAAWWIASKVDQAFSEGVLFGGLMQAASVALNAFLPGFNIGGVPIALSGLADLVQGRFAVPQNPLMGQNAMRSLMGPSAPQGSMAPAGAKVTTSGLGRAYPGAY
jgi:hypothetical protein